MTKGKRKRKRPGHGSGPAPPSLEATLAELDTRAGEIAGCESDEAGPLWGTTHKLLLKAKADPGEVARVIASRDLDALGRLIAALRGDTPAPEAAPDADAGTAAPTTDIPHETLKKAMRAFRKRLKLTRLDHESRLGVGPMTSGRSADFDAILPPHEFPPEVWAALVAEGRLRSLGQGFFMLADESGTGSS
jgi:hypothetical protein